MLGLILAIAVTVLAALAVARLIRDRRRFEALKARERDHTAEVARLRAEREQEVSGLQDELERERARLQTEREWSSELRSKVGRMQQQRGLLSDPDDVRSLVLHTAITLLDAEKGLLLSRRDADGDGRLDLVARDGFENDPAESRLAQRLSERVLEHDETLRENHAPDDATGADAEIDNLVAIPVYIHDEFDGVVVCANRKGGFDEYSDDVLLALGDHAGAVLGNSRLRGELRSAYLSTVRALADAIEVKDPFVRSHSEEVSRYVAAVAARMDLDPRRREELLFGSLLHDVGKIGISERILLKPERLTQEEFSVIKLHPRIGHRLVSGIPALAGIAPAVLHHHERYDGSGYPSGLAGERIPLEARIIGVADSFSAMTAARPYSKAMAPEDACTELERCAGTQFDPEVVQLFVEAVRERPPSPRDQDADVLEAALADPEVDAHRDGGPLLGSPAFSLVDNLTMLYSRAYLQEVADAHVRRAELTGHPFGIVVAEVAQLEDLNRRDGFAAGDDALRAVAASLRRTELRTNGTACRLAGRRFALIIADSDDAATRAAGEALASELADGPGCRLAAATWQPGDSAVDVVDRARAGLSLVSPPR
jgi:HD-GYP domain-containing protein (c-di-GMP phosphodiesterase class II)/GGDEF domain-containing protein